MDLGLDSTWSTLKSVSTGSDSRKKRAWVGDRGVRVPLMADVEALGPCACRLVRVWRASCGPFEGSERLRPGRRGP